MRGSVWLWSAEGVKMLAGIAVVFYLWPHTPTPHTPPSPSESHWMSPWNISQHHTSTAKGTVGRVWALPALQIRWSVLCLWLTHSSCMKLVAFEQKCEWGLPFKGKHRRVYPDETSVSRKIRLGKTSQVHKTETKEILILKTITKQKLLKLKKTSKSN